MINTHKGVSIISSLLIMIQIHTYDDVQYSASYEMYRGETYRGENRNKAKLFFNMNRETCPAVMALYQL